MSTQNSQKFKHNDGEIEGSQRLSKFSRPSNFFSNSLKKISVHGKQFKNLCEKSKTKDNIRPARNTVNLNTDEQSISNKFKCLTRTNTENLGLDNQHRTSKFNRGTGIFSRDNNPRLRKSKFEMVGKVSQKLIPVTK